MSRITKLVAIQQLQNAIKMEPSNGFSQVFLGYTYAAKWLYREAIAEYQKQISIDGETTSALCYLGYALAQSGKRSEAQALLRIGVLRAGMTVSLHS